MSKFGKPMFYSDTDTNLDDVKERLLISLLELPRTCFFRQTPKIVSEKQFETDVVLHKAYYRFTEVEEDFSSEFIQSM